MKSPDHLYASKNFSEDQYRICNKTHKFVLSVFAKSFSKIKKKEKKIYGHPSEYSYGGVPSWES